VQAAPLRRGASEASVAVFFDNGLGPPARLIIDIPERLPLAPKTGDLLLRLVQKTEDGKTETIDRTDLIPIALEQIGGKDVLITSKERKHNIEAIIQKLLQDNLALSELPSQLSVTGLARFTPWPPVPLDNDLTVKILPGPRPSGTAGWSASDTRPRDSALGDSNGEASRMPLDQMLRIVVRPEEEARR
jgi:hypothetical protein